MEKSSLAVRSVYGSHVDNEVFRRLTRLPRLLEPAVQLLGGPVYVYQFKINAKIAFLGDVWEWHQDFVFWQKEDGVRHPNLVTVGVFLDEVTEFNGPLMFIPGSHKEGALDPATTDGVPKEYAGRPGWIANLTADLKYTVDRASLARLVSRNGIAAPKGPAGSALFFHCNVVHGSAPNLSPFDRKMVLLTYNRADNPPEIGERSRPEFLVSRDWQSLSPLPDGALLH